MPAIHRRWTSADVRTLINESPRYWPRYELIGGELIVTPSPRFPHQTAAQELWFILKHYLVQQGVGLPMMAPADLELVPENITQPDVFVLDPHSVDDTVEMPTWADLNASFWTPEVCRTSLVWQPKNAQSPLTIDLPTLFETVWTMFDRLKNG